VIAVATLAELERFDHPWVQDYFNGPRGRAARSGPDRAHALPPEQR
jgi:phospholipid/cholesterol/gamma-HCH transport system ATP-binding protein